MEEKNSMCSNWQGDQGIESDKDNKHEKIAVIPLKQLKDFKNHPFKPTFPKSITMVELFPKKGIAPSVFLLLHQ